MTERRRDLLVVVLAFVSGYTDGVGFLALGGAFTSVMTGNMVLLGLTAGDGNLQGVGRAAGAILAFTAGCAIGTHVSGVAGKADPVWPAPVNRGLAAEAAIVVAAGIGWLAPAAALGRPSSSRCCWRRRPRWGSRAAPCCASASPACPRRT